MNPRITDLLDDYVDTSVQLFPPDQVLRGTGSGKKKSQNPKPSHHRMKKPLVIAAALLLVLTGIAVAGLKLSNVGSTGTSLNAPEAETPDAPAAQDSGWTAESSIEESTPAQEDIVLDDSNSVIVTSEATGLSIRVPTEFQDGLKTDDNLVLTADIGSPFEQSFNFNGIFTFYDTSNQGDYYGVVFTIDTWDQSDFDAYLSDPTIECTFTLNSAVVGKAENSYYRMLQFGTPNLSVIPNFDNGNPDSAKSYYEYLKYAIPMVNSFIELNGLDPVETGLDGWDELFRQRVLEPMEELISQLENETPQQDTQETEQTANYAELDLSLAKDLHYTQPNIFEESYTTLTSSTGLCLNVMTACVDAGEFYVDSTITLENEFSCDIDVVFAAYDQRNLDSGGLLWAIIDGSPESMPLELPDGYQWDVMGQLYGETYSIIMPTADNLQYNENSLPAVTSYDDHINAQSWNLSEVIRAVTNYTPYEDGTQDWERDYQELVCDPVYDRLSELEQARQNSLQPIDSSRNLPAAEDADGDGLLTAELNIPVETEYGTAILQKFTLDPSTLEFSWYTDLSGLSGSFAEYGSDLSTALKEREGFQAEFASVCNTVQEVILSSMLVYPDNSHVCLGTGELNAYGTQSYRSYDTLGGATQFPTSAENPSCLEIGGVTYSLS